MNRLMGRLVLSGLIAAALVGCQSSRVAEPTMVRGNLAAARADNAQATALIEKSKFAEAEPILKHAIEEDPTYGPALNNLGLVYYEMDRLYDAAWQLQNAIRLMPTAGQPQNNLGLVLEKAGKLNEAEPAYAKAHELEPRNPEYAGNDARVRLKLGTRDAKTRELLQIVVMADTRPEWVEWARFNFTRLRGEDGEFRSTTQPIR